jgi:hypothetical protein
MNTVLILLSSLFLINSNDQALEVESMMINVNFITVLKNSDDVIPLTITEIISGSERIGVISGDFDGASSWSICSKKIIGNKIILRVWGINCKPFEKEYEVTNDLKFSIELEYGESKLKNRKDREVFIRKDLGIPFCGTTDLFMEEMENATYQHCDGRIKQFNEIPQGERYQWDKIEK